MECPRFSEHRSPEQPVDLLSHPTGPNKAGATPVDLLKDFVATITEGILTPLSQIPSPVKELLPEAKQPSLQKPTVHTTCSG